MSAGTLGWPGILKLGLVQTALGSVVVLTTSTMNRLMVVELALPAMLPGALVGLHYALQLSRPRLGYGSDVGGRRVPWIVGGMAALGAGALAAALAIALMGTQPALGIALAVVAFTAIGLGVGAAGTTLLVLLAKRVAPARRAAAAMVVWVMMIGGFVLTAAVVGRLLDPYSPLRLIAITAAVAAAALVLTMLAVRSVEGRFAAGGATDQGPGGVAPPQFRQALREVWREPSARRFALFIFVSMLSFSAQDLILEPFAGIAFGYTPGESTRLSGLQNAGVLVGMVGVGLLAGRIRGWAGSLRVWTLAGCMASAIALAGLAMAAAVPHDWPLRSNVFALGVANGMYAVAAIGSMMGIVGAGVARREGVRMGLWGAAQAIAFGLGGFLGTMASDALRWLLGSATLAYGTVFALEALGFLVAAALAVRLTAVSPGLGRAVPALAGARGE